MTSMDEYARRQVIRANLELNLKELQKERVLLLNDLVKLDKMIEKHVEYIEYLEED